jgi:hypothetical protein
VALPALPMVVSPNHDALLLILLGVGAGLAVLVGAVFWAVAAEKKAKSRKRSWLAEPTDNPDPGYPTGGAGPGFGA